MTTPKKKMTQPNLSALKAEILVVEDSPTQARFLSRILEGEGYTVTTAQDGVAALEILAQHSFPLVLTDVQMPRMDGIQLCREIQSLYGADVSVILVTSLAAPDDIIRGIEAGADDYIIKPYQDRYLLDKVRDELSHPQQICPKESVVNFHTVIGEQTFDITAAPEHILKLMVSTYQNAINQNDELLRSQVNLEQANQELSTSLKKLKISQNEIQASEERFRSIVRLVPDIIYRLDQEGRFVFVNEAVVSLGYMPEEIIGQHFSAIVHPDDLPQCSYSARIDSASHTDASKASQPKLFDERRTGERATEGLQVRLINKAGKTYQTAELYPLVVEVNSAGYYGGDEVSGSAFNGSVGAIRDITERARMEEELVHLNLSLEEKVEKRTHELVATNSKLSTTLDTLKTTQEQIIQSEKLTALGTLIAGIAHELNNPLMGSLNYVEYGIKHCDDEKMEGFLVKARDNIQRAARIIRNMLNYARVSHDEKAEFTSLSEVIDSVFTLLTAELNKRDVEIENNITKDLPMVYGTPQGLQQVFFNLVTNAIQAMKDMPVRVIRFDAKSTDKFVIISVKDTGPGIPPESINRVFDPFFTTKPPGEGTGLGLSISSGILDGFGASISYEKGEDIGANFKITLSTKDIQTAQHQS